MPLTIAINDLVRVNFIGQCFGQKIVLTHAYRKSAGNTALDFLTELGALVDELKVGGGVDLLTPYLACLPDDYQMVQIDAQKIKTTRYIKYSSPTVVNGTHISPATVANDSACITLKGELASRRSISNKHIGPVPDAVSNSGLLQAAYRTKLATLAEKMLVDMTVAGVNVYKPCIINGPNAIGYTEVEFYSIGLQSRVQRRRTVGLGE